MYFNFRLCLSSPGKIFNLAFRCFQNICCHGLFIALIMGDRIKHNILLVNMYISSMELCIICICIILETLFTLQQYIKIFHILH